MAGPLDLSLAIDGILALLAIETLFLVGLRAWWGVGPASASTIANAMAGAALLLAMRAAIAGAAFPIISACLLGALAAHLADLKARWRGAPRADRIPPHSQAASAALAPERSRV